MGTKKPIEHIAEAKDGRQPEKKKGSEFLNTWDHIHNTQNTSVTSWKNETKKMLLENLLDWLSRYKRVLCALPCLVGWMFAVLMLFGVPP
jgi:hypothetical protein